MCSKSFLLALAGTLVLFPGKADAGKILWGNSITPDSNFQSNGVDSLDTGFTFALGTFGASFTPDSTNVDLWASNWSQLDTADYNTNFDYFTRETDLVKNDQFGQKTYIWIYNTLNSKVNREWLLVTGKPAAPWSVPAFPGDQTSFPPEYSITGPEIDVVFGRYDAPDDPILIPPSQGLGDFTGTPKSYILQTGSLPIPEPSIAGLLAAGLMGCLRRSRTGTAVKGVDHSAGLSAMRPSLLANFGFGK